MVRRSGGLPQRALDSIEKNALVNASRHAGKADVGAVISGVLGEMPELRPMAGQVAAEVRSLVGRINSMPVGEQAVLLRNKYPQAGERKEREGREGLPPLPNAMKGKASFRLPPEPSGFMHIGHAMAFTINYLYSRMYAGELWLRFEDTNPRKASRKYYESFRSGIKWLGIEFDHEKNVSEDNELIYGYGRKLLEEGQAYACSCGEARVKELRFEGTPCEHRELGAKSNLRRWEEMLARKHREGSYVIRLKGDMKSADYSLRDPNMFRIIEREHAVTGSRFVVWPTYDLANTVEDQVCGITHVLRSSEFHTALQQLLREKLSFRRVEVVQFSRFNFKGTPVHKRLLRPLVEEGLVSGWDDPRMPTVAGVKRRGILPEAIRQFTLQVGYTKTEHEYDWSLLFAVNRKLLDPVSRRVFFVPGPVALDVEGAPRRKVDIPFHPEVDLGSRTIETSGRFFVPSEDLERLETGAQFRLMDLYNLELVSLGDKPLARYAGDELTQGTKKVQWVTEDSEEVKVLVPDVLYNEKGEFNRDSLREVKGRAEPTASGLGEGEVVQFPRYGFCRLDSPGVFVFAHR